MSDITITRPMQVGLLLAIVAAIAALTATQLPELQRYLKIRAM
ncbi:MAG TPA: hypothetical protein VGO29_08140 [Solirubrobacteraceae bacterium]|jgi:hypothetical protein|nr:hypothetical protein [Solirubrobacteraceae bacterium]